MWSYIHLHMAVDTHAEFGYAAWASAQSLVMPYGSVRRIWLCAESLTRAQNHTKFIQKKLAVFFKGTVRRWH